LADDTPLVVLSAASGRPFRITTEEIKRCRRLKAPLPRLAYDERMEARAREISNITPRRIRCPKSGAAVETHLHPDAPGILWDRAAYELEFA